MYPQLEFSPLPKVLSPQEQKNQSKEEEVIGFGSSIFLGYAWLKTSFRTEIESRSTRYINSVFREQKKMIQAQVTSGALFFWDFCFILSFVPQWVCRNL